MSVLTLYSKDVAYNIPGRKSPVAYSTCATYYSIGAFICERWGSRIVRLSDVVEAAEDYFWEHSEELQILRHLLSFQKKKSLIVKGEAPYRFMTGVMNFTEI